MRPKRDVSGHQDMASQTGTVPVKLGRLVTLVISQPAVRCVLVHWSPAAR